MNEELRVMWQEAVIDYKFYNPNILLENSWKSQKILVRKAGPDQGLNLRLLEYKAGLLTGVIFEVWDLNYVSSAYRIRPVCWETE